MPSENSTCEIYHFCSFQTTKKLTKFCVTEPPLMHHCSLSCPLSSQHCYRGLLKPIPVHIRSNAENIQFSGQVAMYTIHSHIHIPSCSSESPIDLNACILTVKGNSSTQEKPTENIQTTWLILCEYFQHKSLWLQDEPHVLSYPILSYSITIMIYH